jgi:NAD(P)-dependent dehydrogenase (short-subunit alcohol dehydrogenase family)
MKIIKHVIISGGGSGLGLGLASRYLKRGIRVSVLDLSISGDRKKALDKSAKTYQSKWQFLKTDVTNANLLKDNVKQAISEFGPIDLAINSAGVVINKSFEDTSPEDFKRVIDINLNGSFNFASAVLPTMKSGAQLALIASIAGLISNYAYSAYGASKFGVVGLATTLRYEYEHKGIHISCVCPPEVKTPMVAEELKNGNKVSLALKKFGGSMDADVACDQIISGLDAGKWMVIPSLNAKFLATTARVFPTPFYGLMKQIIKYTEKKFSSL